MKSFFGSLQNILFHVLFHIAAPFLRLLVFPMGEELGEKCVDASGAAALVVSSVVNLNKRAWPALCRYD